MNEDTLSLKDIRLAIPYLPNVAKTLLGKDKDYVTVHPFEDGNGRIARTIADMLLARADRIAQRFYSMSAQIWFERKSYYEVLEITQRGCLDITDWLIWFLQCLNEAILAADENFLAILRKARYWELLRTKSLNERQKLMIAKLLDGFDGKLNTTKWAEIVKCSHDTALRDINNLMEQGLLAKESAGSKNTAYCLLEKITNIDYVVERVEHL